MHPSEYNLYSCPCCEADVEVPLPAAKFVTCNECQTKLEIHPDADFEDGMWHDLTTLSIVEEDREHRETMLKHGLDWIARNVSSVDRD